MNHRYLKITIKTSVGVYLPRDSGASRAVMKEALQARLQALGDEWSDGRKRFAVEQLQNASETIVRRALTGLVEDCFRGAHGGTYQKAIQEGGSAGEFVQNKLEDDVALAMTRVSVAETPISDHVLEFEIEEDREEQETRDLHDGAVAVLAKAGKGPANG